MDGAGSEWRGTVVGVAGCVGGTTGVRVNVVHINALLIGLGLV